MGVIVAGLEADIQGSAIKGSARLSPIFKNDGDGTFIPGSFRSSDQKLAWFGTLRGRLGATAPGLACALINRRGPVSCTPRAPCVARTREHAPELYPRSSLKC
jgi:hypothetical protein